jgi:transcriptional regulator with XRE-family HTH domain
MVDLVDWGQPGMRAALAQRDITAVYRLLARAGLSQRRIGALTGQSQGEVSEIIHGRQVLSYDVLARIADGLGVSRGWMGLAYDPSSERYASDIKVGDNPHTTTTIEEASEPVKRRLLLASATMALVDRPVLGALVALDQTPVATPLPTKIVQSDVDALHALTEELRALGRAGHGGMPEVLRPIVHRADRLERLPATSDAVQRALWSQIADLHTLTGWAYTDKLQVDSARYHYSRALKLTANAGDALGMVSAAAHAAHMDVDQGAPNDGLKLYQMAQMKLADVPADHPGLPAYQALLPACSAHCWALMDRPDHANDQLKRLADLPPVEDLFERADLDYIRAKTRLAQGPRYVEGAAHYAFTSVNTWSPQDRRDSALARITLATTHVILGERDAAALTTAALEAVSSLRSAHNRTLLAPLEQALSARKDNTSVDLAQRAQALLAAT